jgi:hypothetical protein
MCREYFSIIFNVKKVRTIPEKIHYVIFEFDELKKLTNSGPTENSKTVGVGTARED